MPTPQLRVLAYQTDSTEIAKGKEVDLSASNNTFDNSSNNFTADNVQAAIEEARDSARPKAGKIAAGSFSGNPKKATVSFNTVFSNNNYSVSITPIVTASSNASWSSAIENKSASGFTINMNANSINGLLDVMWIATPHSDP